MCVQVGMTYSFRLVVAACAVALLPCSAQTAHPADTAASLSAPTASELLQPGLAAVDRALPLLHLSKWKLPGAARDEVQANLGSVHRDLDSTLPPLLSAADSTPSNLSSLLPVSRNVTALYDVLLRLMERGKTSAPANDVTVMEQARAALDTARRAFDQDLQAAAETQEATVKRLQAPPPAAPAPCPPAAVPPPPKKKAKPRPKPAPQG